MQFFGFKQHEMKNSMKGPKFTRTTAADDDEGKNAFGSDFCAMLALRRNKNKHNTNNCIL